MSALVWEATPDGYAVPAGPGRDAPPSRQRHLVLVPTGAGAGDTAGLRLTRRGRFVLAALLLGLAAVVGLVVLPGAGSSGSTTAPTRIVTVLPGQTLSEIAARELPSLSAGQAMTAIRVANALNTTSISAGETLVIPQT